MLCRGLALRQHGVEVEKERQRRYAVTDSRLKNWGLVYRGGYPKPSLSSGPYDDRPTLDELDAAVVERVMVDLLSKSDNSKRGRGYRRLYKLARLMYLGDKPMTVLTQAFRRDERGIQRLHGKLLDYVATYLEIGAAE